MAEAARIVEEVGADACDINMGCPANKVLKGCAGCSLMGDLDLAGAIVGAARRAPPPPPTLEVPPAAARTPHDAVRMLPTTGCDGVMIGRASMKNPWIYRQAADLLAGRTPREPTVEERRDLILHHFRLLLEQE